MKRDLLSFLDLKSLNIKLIETDKSIVLPSSHDDVRTPLEFNELNSELFHDSGISQSKKESSLFESLNQIFTLFFEDVKTARERLSNLNLTRRKMIERRLEFIARKIAFNSERKFQSTISLNDVLNPKNSTNPIIIESWHVFQSEVALYNIFELFFLKALQFHGLRTFEIEDIRKLNFSAHQYLSQHAVGFSKDNHCWNFVRNNLYSWYVPTTGLENLVDEKILAIEQNSPLAWSDKDLLNWTQYLFETKNLSMFDFYKEVETSQQLLSHLKKALSFNIVQQQKLHKSAAKILFPTLGRGGFALAVLDELLSHMHSSVFVNEKEFHPETHQLQNSIWACESENFELYWAEVMSLLKTISKCSTDKALPSHSHYTQGSEQIRFRIPQVLHSVNRLALELHNLEQLPLENSNFALQLQGSAGNIQQNESFDLAIVPDCPHLIKSQNWLQAISDQIPYWKKHIKSNSNLNWGELHLAFALSKLKENGICIYLTHREIPEFKDGEKFRKYILKDSKLIQFHQFSETDAHPLKFIYIFKKKNELNKKQNSNIKLYKISSVQELKVNQVKELEISSHTLSELGFTTLNQSSEEYLNAKLDNHLLRLHQIASVIPYQDLQSEKEQCLITPQHSKDNIIYVWENKNTVTYSSIKINSTSTAGEEPKYIIMPHCSSDLGWIECALNSKILKERLKDTTKNFTIKINDIKNLPILNTVPSSDSEIEFHFDNLSSIKKNKIDLLNWIEQADEYDILWCKFLATVKRYLSLNKLLKKYGSLIQQNITDTDSNNIEIKSEAVTSFYPERMLCKMNQIKDLKVKYYLSESTSLPAESWLLDTYSFQTIGKRTTYILKTKQGPSITINMVYGLENYITSQLKKLKGFNWLEIQDNLKIPADHQLFIIQFNEIIRVLKQTIEDTNHYSSGLDVLIKKLFETPVTIH